MQAPPYSATPNSGIPPTGGSWFASTGFLPQFNAPGNGGLDPGNPSEGGRAGIGKLFGELRQRLRPWSTEFFRVAKFGWPLSLATVPLRIKYNLEYFLTNYLCLSVILMIYCVLTSFLMLLALIVMCGLFYTIYQRTIKGPLLISGHEVPPSLMYTLALIVCFPLFALANVGEVMYWVIGSSLALILAHATFYCSEEVPGAEFEVVTVVNA